MRGSKYGFKTPSFKSHGNKRELQTEKFRMKHLSLVFQTFVKLDWMGGSHL
jgi:hypothetical protein